MCYAASYYYMGVVDVLATLEDSLMTPESLHLLYYYIIHVLLILTILPPNAPTLHPSKGQFLTGDLALSLRNIDIIPIHTYTYCMYQ